MREVADTELPATARRLAETARTYGWAVRCTQAEQPDGKSSVAVRLARETRMWAIWIDGKFSTGACAAPLHRMNVTQLKERVTA